MARSNRFLIQALEDTANRLEASGSVYRWSHFAHCNCGHLAQTVTGLSPREIYQAALERPGDWHEQATTAEWPDPDYGDRPALDEGAWQPEDLGACTTSGLSMVEIFERMSEVGLDADDVAHLERLSDPKIRKRLGTNTVEFNHSDRSNVVGYLRAWAAQLAEELDDEREPIELPVAAE